MRRAWILIALTVALLSAVLSTGASAGTSAPRGVLTKVEYQELLASYKAMKQAGKQHGTPTHVARHTCRALTDATKLTAAERGECQASLIYTYWFFAFPYAMQQCAKGATAARRVRCALTSVGVFQKAVLAFIRTNAASTRATAPRHFSKRCLEYLIFTPQQARTTTALAAGLKRYARALRSGNTSAVTGAGNRINSDLVASRQAMSFNISLSVCRHQ
jgi:hypothetical protein